MTHSHHLFADGVLDIVVQNGVARIDFFAYSATEKAADGSPETDFQQRVGMPLPAFAQTFGAMERVMNELIDRSVITRTDAQAENGAAPAKTTSKAKN